MDKKSAWMEFFKTGRVDDYLNYLKVSNINSGTEDTAAREDMAPYAENDRWDSNWHG